MADDERFLRDLDWNLLKNFYFIAQFGGVTAAAGPRARHQPAVSLGLKRLEERLGTDLCQRGPGGFSLYEEGELVAKSCAEIARCVRDMPRLLADIAPHVTGTLRIAWLTGMTHDPLDRALCRFRQTYPGVQLRIDVASEETIARAVQRNDVDIGISSNRVRIAELDAHLLFRERHQAYCGRGFPLFGKAIERLEDHADAPFILGGVDEPDRLKEFRHRTGVGRNAVAMSDNIAEQRRLTVLGLGICFLPVPYVAEDVAAGRLWPLTPDRTDWEIDIFALTSRRTPHRHLIGAFLEELQKPASEPACRPTA